MNIMNIMNDFETIEYYTAIIESLAQAYTAVCDNDQEIDVVVDGIECKMQPQQLKFHIKTQKFLYECLLQDVQDRVIRNEGKVG